MSIEISEERGVRYLHFGSRWIQGAMRIARPFALELEYTRELMMPLLLQPSSDWPRDVLVIGLGAGSVVKFLYKHRPRACITVAEIERDVLHAAWQFFRLPDDTSRLTFEIEDGQAFVARCTTRYDLVLVDAYDAKGTVGALDTVPFYRRVRERLTRRGIVAINALSRRAPATATRLGEAFDGRALALPPSPSGNVIVLAAHGEAIDTNVPVLRSEAAQLRRDTGLNLVPTITRLERTLGSAGATFSL